MGSALVRWALPSYVLYHVHILMLIPSPLPYSTDEKQVRELSHTEEEGIT